MTATTLVSAAPVEPPPSPAVGDDGPLGPTQPGPPTTRSATAVAGAAPNEEGVATGGRGTATSEQVEAGADEGGAAGHGAADDGQLAATADGVAGPDCVAGSLTGVGTPTVEPVLRRAAELYLRSCPAAEFVIDELGPAAAFSAACAGRADVVLTARSATADERAACADRGRELIGLTLAREAVVVATDPATRLDCLVVGDLPLLFGEAATGSSTWDELTAGADPAPAVHLARLTGPVSVIGPDPGTPLHQRMVELTGTAGRTDHRRADAESLAAVIGGGSASVGWLSYRLATEAEADGVVSLVPMAVAAGDPCVEPSEAEIAAGRYPAARPVVLHVVAGGPGDAGPAFARLVVDELHGEVLATGLGPIGLVPVDPIDLAEAARQLDAP